MNKPIKMEIRTVSPVHIGDGGEYDPVDYIINGNRMDFYDPKAVSAAILAESSEKFMEYCKLVKTITFDNKDSLARFYKFISPYVSNGSINSVQLTKYAETRFSPGGKTTPISTLIKNKYQKLPYIPGSTVKGMLKTIMYWYYYKNKSEKNIPPLPSGDNDPWRLVEVSDFQPYKVNSQIDLPANLHKLTKGTNQRKVSGIPNALELIGEGSRFIGTITFNESLYKIAKNGNDDFAKNVNKFFEKPLDSFMIADAIKKYGDALLTKENTVFNTGGKFYSENRNVPSTELEDEFNKWWRIRLTEIQNTDKPTRFIKLGKHAGAISKMFYGGDDFYNGKRNVIIPQQKKGNSQPQINDTQTTIWLSSTGQPLGWAKIFIGINESYWDKAMEERKELLALATPKEGSNDR